MTEQYRIQDKEPVSINSRPATSFKLFERNGDAFVYAGTFFRPGTRNATDAQCIAFAEEERGNDLDYDEHDPDPVRAY